MNTGEKIKYYRTKQGLSAEDLASSIGVSPSTIYRYENNDIANMGIDKLKLIASALHTHSYILLGWDDESESENLHESSPEIVILMEQLNSEGQEKVIEYAEGLIALGKYKKHGEPELGQKEA